MTQSEGPILTAIASFQEQGQSGVEFSDTMPQDVPAPETLTSAKELMEPYADKSPFAKFYAKKSPFDIRHVTPTIMLGADKDSAAHDSGKQLVWMKADGVVDVPQVMHRAMLALGCDQVMMEPVLRRRAEHLDAWHLVRVDRPFDVVVSRRGHQPVAPVRARYADRRARAWTGRGQGVHAGRRARRRDGAGGHDPRATAVRPRTMSAAGIEAGG